MLLLPPPVSRIQEDLLHGAIGQKGYMKSSDSYQILSIEYSDYIELVQMYRDFHAESYARDLINFDADMTIRFLDNMVEHPDRNFAVKCTNKNKIVGFYMGSLSTMDFSSTLIGFERGFYVRKDSRGTRAAALLKQSYFNWLMERGVKPAIATIFHSEDNNSTYQFCEKMGMREVGRVFERVL